MYLMLALCAAYAIISSYLNDGIQKHSVPLFALGAIASLIKNHRYSILKFCAITISVGILVSSIAFLTSHPLTGFLHCIFDYLAVLATVIFISIKRLRLKASIALSAITFDIYLIHYKVLVLETNMQSLTLFLILSIPISVVISHLFLKLRSFLIKF